MSSSNLWWSYDAENGSFQALPPGPFLLPAIGIFAFVALVRAIKGNGCSERRTLGDSFYESARYQNDKKRHDYLVKKSATKEGLGLAEHDELWRLQHPEWANGLAWFYY